MTGSGRPGTSPTETTTPRDMMGVESEERTLPDPDGTEETAEATPPRVEPPPRPACPRCGSLHTQPFGHAGPAARVNMKCIDCDMLFKQSVHRD